ncbi:MAG: hypothetical protein M1826_005484, partial [Phylliscum demangeonii]
MSFIGYVFNKARNKNILVYLAIAGPGFWRPVGVLSIAAKKFALAKLKGAFEAGNLFTEEDMKTMERLD